MVTSRLRPLPEAAGDSELGRQGRMTVDALREPEIIDPLHVLEHAMRHYFLRAQTGVNVGCNQSEIDRDYKEAAALAAMLAPYRHARLSAVKVAGDPNHPARFKDNATADELREEIMRRLAMMREAGILDLEALPPPKR
jgi:hypothetical protein